MYSGKDGFTAEELKYLQLLSKQYKNINSAATEVMNLKAILNLPKGTEHFVSDIHGEVESFSHVLRNASGVIKKLLESAIANAENNNGLSAENLYIAECYANKGPTMKRIQPRAQGRAYRIEKRMSHITIVLDEK